MTREADQLQGVWSRGETVARGNPEQGTGSSRAGERGVAESRRR